MPGRSTWSSAHLFFQLRSQRDDGSATQLDDSMRRVLPIVNSSFFV